MKKNRVLADKAISLLLKPHGFTKKGSIWTLDVGDARLGVHLQGSRFSKGLAHLNFLAWYGALAEQAHTSFQSDFHLSFRGDVDLRDEIDALLTFDDSDVNFESFVTQLNELFFDQSLQRLLRLSTLERAIAAVRADEMRGYTDVLWNAAQQVTHGALS